MPTATDDYDWQDDHRKNIEFAYAFIRDRVAKGGKGWRGYPMSAWQPRSTAPSDTMVLVHGPRGYALAEYSHGYWYGCCENDLAYEGQGESIRHPDPTHWMPLPEPPK